MNNLLYRLMRRIRKSFSSKLAYMFWEDNESLNSHISGFYTKRTKMITKPSNPCLIIMIDGRFPHGGLSDRLRGCINLYKFAKERNIDFRIYWKSPFDIHDYLTCNEYDWKIEKNEISYSLDDSLPVALCSYYKQHSISECKEADFQYKKMNDILDSHPHIKQFHFYTNAHFVDDKEYAELFKELFGVSEDLQQKISFYKKAHNGSPYFSMSFRFRQLLGDFQDASGGEVLSIQERKQYIEDSLHLIDKIHKEKNGEQMIFVTSDSKDFIKAASKKPYVFTVSGEIVHIDKQCLSENKEDYSKEFLDMLMLAQSTFIYICKKERMFMPGFPVNSAKLGGVKFSVVKY